MLSIDAWLDEKPYKELYDGMVHEKVSPRSDHAKVALQCGILLARWAGALGDVGVEWRVYLAEGTTLVPDVAFVSHERLAPLSEHEKQKPPFAPDIVVEVRSPDDREGDIRRKTQLYLAHGALLVLNVDPSTRTILLDDARSEVVLHEGDILRHPAFPELLIAVSDIFAPLGKQS